MKKKCCSLCIQPAISTRRRSARNICCCDYLQTIMAHLFRTTSMISTKKQHQQHNGNGISPGNGIFPEDSKIYNHKMTNTQQSRHNTMHPRVRDSVLNTGCSDRSSSTSDELFLPFPSEIEDHTSLMNTCNMESLMRSAYMYCTRI